MTVVVLGVDALDADIVNQGRHPNLTLESYCGIDTIVSSMGKPSTHELWPTILTGLRPREHGLVLDDGVAWDNPLLRIGSDVADYILPNVLQNRIGAWLLNTTDQDAFRVPATYYEANGLTTVFDGRRAMAIGIPNFVVEDDEDREHKLRRSLGDLFERDPTARGGHTSSDPVAFYEQCLEMAMVRIARVRRSLRSGNYELVFGYTSAIDLIGHVAYDQPALQAHAYDEMNEFVGELAADLAKEDELLLVSDHGLQEGLHTETAMVAGTDEEMIEAIESVLDVRAAISTELDSGRHMPDRRGKFKKRDSGDQREIRQQLEDLGYM